MQQGKYLFLVVYAFCNPVVHAVFNPLPLHFMVLPCIWYFQAANLDLDI